MPSNQTHPVDQARLYLSKGKADQAVRLLKKHLKIEPQFAPAHHFLGLVQYQQGQHSAAAQSVAQAISLDPSDPVMHHNAGLICLALEQHEDAVAAFDRAIALDANYAEAWFNRGNAHRQLGQETLARQDFQQTLAIDAFFADAHNNLGLSYKRTGDLDAAVAAFDRCLQIQPNHHLAMNNLALAKQSLGELKQAQQLFESALALVPTYAVAHINLGHLLQQQGDFNGAVEHYQAAYKLVPTLDLLAGYLAQSKGMVCQWQGLEQLWQAIEKQITKGPLPCTPFALLGGIDSLALSQKLASGYANRHIPYLGLEPFEAPTPAAGKRKLRIGYLSSDFKDHPVAYLTVGIIENHSREDFEVIGFSIGKPGDGPLGQRIRSAFDTFVDLSAMTDAQAVQTVRSYGLDIAMDITGYTDGCRPAILKARVAPIQVNYYGFAGTMGTDFMDYIVGDAVLMPPGSERFYNEKIIYMPECHQPNDDQRPISDEPITRAEHGLPSDVFVYCSFNKPYKILPNVFACWMRILKSVTASVLWLQSTDDTVITNLKRAAQKAGVDPDRLIFAGRTPTTADHLARYRLADLFLDTYPYTAHTTANDALWAGLPVLGLSGETFAARVSESLLTTLGLPDLVMRSLPEYEARAIELGLVPAPLTDYRGRLEQGKATSSLYKPKQLATWLEQGLKTALERHHHQQPPAHIEVTRS